MTPLPTTADAARAADGLDRVYRFVSQARAILVRMPDVPGRSTAEAELRRIEAGATYAALFLRAAEADLAA